MRPKTIGLATWVLAALMPPSAGAEETTVAVASNFTGAMRALVEVFERETGHEVVPVFGASGRFTAQVSNGAPFDVFFSADRDKPIALERNGLAVAGTRFTYALGGLVLWSLDGGLVDAGGQVLRDRGFSRLALANPRLAPYGLAATEALGNLGLLESLRSTFVQGENIAQTYQFVSSGNAELGFLALSQVTRDGEIVEGSGWIVPRSLYRPIRQDAVLLGHGAENQAARQLLDFVRSDRGRVIIESFGYGVGGYGIGGYGIGGYGIGGYGIGGYGVGDD